MRVVPASTDPIADHHAVLHAPPARTESRSSATTGAMTMMTVVATATRTTMPAARWAPVAARPAAWSVAATGGRPWRQARHGPLITG